MASQTKHKQQQKMVNLFIKLSEVTGLISRKESLSTQHRLKTTVGRAQGELQELVKKYNIDTEFAQLLWKVTQRSPVVHRENEQGEDIDLEDLDTPLKHQIFFAEQLVKNQMVSLQQINIALAECQQNPSLSIGQVLLRKRALSSEQFVSINKTVQTESLNNKENLRYVSLKQHNNKIYINSSNIPNTIGNYEIICEIARGGMGVVYKAKDPHLNKEVALKTIIGGKAADEIDIERFRREAKLTSQLEHPNIVKIHEIGLQEDLHYYTMDFVDGVSLSEYVKQQRPPLRKLLKIFLQVAQALAAAHSQGIIHRDIKPSNILVDQTGKPFLTDFGLARQQGGKDGLTISGVAIGTPAYMSPEQAEGRIREIDHRSDIYSLGAVFYELLCGEPPFSGNSLADTLQKILTKEPVRLRQLVPNIPVKVETICLKCLKKTRGQRYNNAKALIRDVERFLRGGDIKAKRSAPLEIARRWVSDHKSNVVVFLVTALVFSVLCLAFFLRMGDMDESRQQLKNSLTIATDSIQSKQTEIESLKKKVNQIEGKLAEKNAKESLEASKNSPTQHGISDKELADLYNNSGVAHLNIGKKPQMASGHFQKAIEHNPRHWSAYYNLGKTLMMLKNYDQALAYFNKVILEKKSVDPLLVRDCYLEKSFALHHLGRFNESTEAANQRLTFSIHPDCYNLIGLNFYKQGPQYEKKAMSYLTKAIEISRGKPNTSVVYIYNRGIVAFDFKNYAQAKKDFQESLRINPQYRRAEIQDRMKRMGH